MATLGKSVISASSSGSKFKTAAAVDDDDDNAWVNSAGLLATWVEFPMKFSLAAAAATSPPRSLLIS